MEMRYVDGTELHTRFCGVILVIKSASILQFDNMEMADSLEKSRAKSAFEALQVALYQCSYVWSIGLASFSPSSCKPYSAS